MSNIAIIPARSGSKGLKDKNIKMLKGKPMLAYTIEAALESGLFECVHVSTDSEKYAEIARQYGAEVPFLRSEKTSSDSAGSWDVVKEVLNRYTKMGRGYDIVTLLQPTSPLRSEGDIVQAYRLFFDKKADAVVSVCEMEHSPLWCNTLPDDLSMANFIGSAQSQQRQKLKTFYRINGSIYIVRKDFLYRDSNIYRNGCYAYVMDAKRSIDIDQQYDFDIAEALLEMGV